MLEKTKNKDLLEYLHRCAKYRNIDVQRAYTLALQALNYYRGSKKQQEVVREGQEIERKWYESLKSTPDYSLYNDDYYIVEVWACWVIYSSHYLKLLRKNQESLVGVQSVVDLGCGFGYTTAGLKELMPQATVTGVNLENTMQYMVAEGVGEEYGFTMQPTVTDHANMVFASEYFEHIQEPIKHLEEVIAVCSPGLLVIANSFGSTSMGHFNEYLVDGAVVSNKKIGRLFNNRLRNFGYRQIKSGYWNNRPAVWIR